MPTDSMLVSAPGLTAIEVWLVACIVFIFLEMDRPDCQQEDEGQRQFYGQLEADRQARLERVQQEEQLRLRLQPDEEGLEDVSEN